MTITEEKIKTGEYTFDGQIYNEYKRVITGPAIVTVNIGDESTRINARIINSKIDEDDSLTMALINAAIKKIYGQSYSFLVNNGYPAGDGYCYGQVVTPNSTVGLNCTTGIIIAEVE